MSYARQAEILIAESYPKYPLINEIRKSELTDRIAILNYMKWVGPWISRSQYFLAHYIPQVEAEGKAYLVDALGGELDNHVMFQRELVQKGVALESVGYSRIEGGVEGLLEGMQNVKKQAGSIAKALPEQSKNLAIAVAIVAAIGVLVYLRT